MQISIHNIIEYGVKTTMDKIKMTQNIWEGTFTAPSVTPTLLFPPLYIMDCYDLPEDNSSILL